MALQRQAVPICKLRRCFVSALSELHNRRAWIAVRAHVVIRQQELMELVRVGSFNRAHWLLPTTLGFGSCITVECRPCRAATARPPANTYTLMRVGLRGNYSFPRRSGATVEPRATQIEASPKKVNRTRLADKSGSKLLEHRVD